MGTAEQELEGLGILFVALSGAEVGKDRDGDLPLGGQNVRHAPGIFAILGSEMNETTTVYLISLGLK